MGSTYSQVLYHIVFATKRRMAWLSPDIRDRIHAFMGGIVRGERGMSFGIGGMPDHVHMLVRWRTDESVAYLLRNVKSRSSKWIHETFPALRDFAWQEGYGCFSVSKSQSDVVKMYIADQEEHHRQRTFEEEFTAMLDAHGIEYDPTYVFD